jgi:hypothetical protein
MLNKFFFLRFVIILMIAPFRQLIHMCIIVKLITGEIFAIVLYNMYKSYKRDRTGVIQRR